MIEQLGALFLKGVISVTAAMANIVLAWLGTFLAFMTIPGLRKLAFIVPGIVASSMVGYLVSQVGASWGWTVGVTNVLSSVLGFFTLAVLLVFGKVHEALTVDDSVVAAIVAKLKKWIGS